MNEGNNGEGMRPVMEVMITVAQGMQEECDSIDKEIDEINQKLNPNPESTDESATAEAVETSEEEKATLNERLEALNARKEALERQLGAMLVITSAAADLGGLTDYAGIVSKVIPAVAPVIEAYLPDVVALLKLPIEVGQKVASELEPLAIEAIDQRVRMLKAWYDALTKVGFSPDQAFAVVLAKVQSQSNSSSVAIASIVSSIMNSPSKPDVSLKLKG